MVALIDNGDPNCRTLQVMGELETGKSGPDNDDVMIGHGSYRFRNGTQNLELRPVYILAA